MRDAPESIHAKILQGNLEIEQIQHDLRRLPPHTPGGRRARLFAELTSLSKRYINERIAFEDLLSESGMHEVSASIYAMQWAEIYYNAIERRTKWNERGYWKRLYHALINRKFYI